MWLHNDVEVTVLPECIGFVYLITNNISGRKYIGKKLAHFTKTSIKTVTLKSGLKKKKKVKKLVESDWQSYWSSSTELQNDVKELGEDNFTREILLYCQSKGTLSYMEAKLQFHHEVLEHPEDWYNGIIQVKIHRTHVKL